MNVYDTGRADALASLGLTKTAFIRRAPLMTRMGKWLWSKRPTWKGTKRVAIGQPRRFAKEISEGKAFAPGSLIRQSLHAPDLLTKALFYGYPAVEMGQVAFDDEGNKAQRIGGALGGAALGLATWKPIGIGGSILADMLGREVGGGIGKTVSHLSDKAMGKSKPQKPYRAPYPSQYNTPYPNQYNNQYTGKNW